MADFLPRSRRANVAHGVEGPGNIYPHPAHPASRTVAHL